MNIATVRVSRQRPAYASSQSRSFDSKMHGSPGLTPAITTCSAAASSARRRWTRHEPQTIVASSTSSVAVRSRWRRVASGLRRTPRNIRTATPARAPFISAIGNDTA